MKNKKEVEAFWTRGDIHSRIHSAMTKANLIDKKLENCFKVLELNSDSTLKEIKSRYKILAKKWHPDAQNSVASPNNKDKFIDISNAYKTILKTFTKLETKK